MPVYQAIWDGPARNYRRSGGAPVTSTKRYITIHNTSNDASAEGEASYAKRRTDGTSSHYYCDSNSIVQSLNTDWCANHVGSTEGNIYGISYEITGVNGWTRETWLANVAWGLLAHQIAIDCKHFGIPVRRLTVAEMKAKNQAGFITHDDARLAWGATTHTDPGPGFPMDHLMGLVSTVLNGDDDMTAERNAANADTYLWRLTTMADEIPNIRPFDDSAEVVTIPNSLGMSVKKLVADVAELKGRSSVHLSDADRIAIAAMVAAELKPSIDALATEMRDAVADLGEGGAAAVRADV